MDTLYLVIPCYNEDEVLPETSKRLYEKISVLIENKQIKNDSKIMQTSQQQSTSASQQIAKNTKQWPYLDMVSENKKIELYE